MERVWVQLGHLPAYGSGHLFLTVVALAVGAAVSLPLGILLTRRPRLQSWVMGVVSGIQTVPSLALLAIMVPVFSMIGAVPAIVALTLYSMLPILRNTVTGIQGVDSKYIEAARGIGMTDRQMLWQVQVPLAAPVIIAGLRTSTVWVVGVGTLATAVGAVSLGNYIFSGLTTQNHAAIVVGSLSAAVLALGLDWAVGMMEYGVAERKRYAFALGASVLIMAALGGIVPAAARAIEDSQGEAVVKVGSKPFVEQYILADAIEQRLNGAGISARSVDSLGSTVLFDALRQNQIDVYVDYTGTIWATNMKREDTPPADEVYTEVAAWLDEEHGILCLGALGFENAYALAMRKGQAAELGISDMGGIQLHDDVLRIGGDYEFFDRPEWFKLVDVYGYDFRQEITMDPALLYQALDTEQVDVITAYTTDGKIAAYDLAVLPDERRAFPPYDAVLLIAPARREDMELVEELRPFVGAISTDAMRNANKVVHVEERAVEEAAEQLLQAIGIGSDE